MNWKWRGAQGQPGSCLYCGVHRSLHREEMVDPLKCPQMQIMRLQEALLQIGQSGINTNAAFANSVLFENRPLLRRGNGEK